MCVPTHSDPAAAIRPMIVSISGRPAATSEPKATTSIAMVTGQLTSSDRIIAEWLAALKSLHSPDEPVRATVTPAPDRCVRGPLSASAARTIALVSPAAPAWMTAVCPSRLTDSPGVGGTTRLTRGSARSNRSARVTTACTPGSVTVRRVECTTTCNAALDRPANCLSMSWRAATDCDPDASQPAPESACWALGANNPSPTAMTTHASRTARKWLAVQNPNRPSGP
jgi:hypothetical protein